MLEPRGRGIVLWTLHYAEEVRPPEGYFDDIDAQPEAPLVDLVAKLIDKRTRDWDASLVHDPLQDNLKALIASKKKNRRRSAPRRGKDEPEAPTNVVNILDALKKSLASEKSSRPRR